MNDNKRITRSSSSSIKKDLVNQRTSTQIQRNKRKSWDEDEDEDEDEGEDAIEELTRPQVLKINRVFDLFTNNENINVKPSNQGDGNDSEIEEEEEEENHRVEKDDDDDFGGGGFITDETEREEKSGGGFIVESNINRSDEDSFAGAGGGFMIENDEDGLGKVKGSTAEERRTLSNDKPKKRNRIGLDKVPKALDLLGLPSKDEEILEIFDDAASTDSENDEDGYRDGVEENESDEGNSKFKKRMRFERSLSFNRKRKRRGVSRVKFLKVCAVLMVDNDKEDEENEERGRDSPEEISQEDDDDDDDDDDGEWKISESRRNDKKSSSDRKSRSKKRRKDPEDETSSSSSESSDSDESSHKKITDRQAPSSKARNSRSKRSIKSSEGDHQEVGTEEDEFSNQQKAFEIFKMFFQPDKNNNTFNPLDKNSMNELKIGFNEIRNVSNQLGENFKEEEIREMIDYSKSSTDKHKDDNSYEGIRFLEFLKIFKQIF